WAAGSGIAVAIPTDVPAVVEHRSAGFVTSAVVIRACVDNVPGAADDARDTAKSGAASTESTRRAGMVASFRLTTPWEAPPSVPGPDRQDMPLTRMRRPPSRQAVDRVKAERRNDRRICRTSSLPPEER